MCVRERERKRDSSSSVKAFSEDEILHAANFSGNSSFVLDLSCRKMCSGSSVS